MSQLPVISFLAPTGRLGLTKALLQVGERIARQGRKVVAIDMDLVSPSIGRYTRGDEEGPGLADWVLGHVTTVPLLDSPTGLWVLAAGTSGAVQELLRAHHLTPAKVDQLLEELQGINMEAALVQLPPGQLVTAWGWAASVLRRSVAAVPFAADEPELKRYWGLLKDWVPTRALPPVCPVLSMQRGNNRAGIRVPAVESDGLDPKEALFVTGLPYVGALETATSPGWRDEQFLAAYAPLGDHLHAVLRAAAAPPVPHSILEQVARGFAKSVDLDPEILDTKVQEYALQRSFVIVGRHGAGKSAVVQALRHHGAFVLDPVHFATEGVPEVTVGGDPGVRFLVDSPEESFADPEELRGLLKRASRAHDRGVEVKIFIRPTTLYLAGDDLTYRDYTEIRWRATELLSLALRRASERSPELAAFLQGRIASLPAQREDWTEDQVHAAAEVLFGPAGLVAWTAFVAPLGSGGPEFIPSEVSQLLYFSVRLQTQVRTGRTALIDPANLARAAGLFYNWKLGWLPPHCRELLDEITRKHGGVVLASNQAHSQALAFLLDHGFLYIDDSSQRERTLRVPPRLLAHLMHEPTEAFSVRAPASWNRVIAATTAQAIETSDTRSTAALRLMNEAHQFYQSGDMRAAEGALLRALTLLMDTSDVGRRERLLTMLADVSLHLGNISSAMDYIGSALSLLTNEADSVRRAEALSICAKILFAQHQIDDADLAAKEALALFTKAKADLGRAQVQEILSDILAARGRFDDAHTRLQEARSLYRRLRHEEGVAQSLLRQGQLFWLQHDADRAAVVLEEAQEIFMRLNLTLGQANTLSILGDVWRSRGDLTKAADCYNQSLQQSRILNNSHSEVNGLLDLASVLLDEGRFEQAIPLLEEALEKARHSRYMIAEGRTLLELGRAYTRREQYDTARLHLTDAVQIFDTIGYSNGSGLGRRSLAVVAIKQGDPKLAVQCLRLAEANFQAAGDSLQALDVRIHLGVIQMMQGNETEGAHVMLNALEQIRQTGNRLHRIEALDRVSSALLIAGRSEEAQQLKDEAAAIRAALESPRSKSANIHKK